MSVLIIAAGLTARCGDVNAVYEQRAEARRLSADLLIEFTRAADAANRAVMADTDAVSTANAKQAEAAKQAVEKDVDRLRPLLQRLGDTDESRLLEEFGTKYAEYKSLDRRILDLAVENTNIKAQRLSFGPAQAAADEFRDALEAIVPRGDPWRVKALVATAVAAVREIQALQAPHIAEAEDASMTRLEQRMSAAEAKARKALADLGPLVAPASRPHLAAANAALNRFADLNAQILPLSRRNTNIRSLELSLDKKRRLTEPCEQILRDLQAALVRKTFRGGPHPGGR
jgi:hypothetical protein